MCWHFQKLYFVAYEIFLKTKTNLRNIAYVDFEIHILGKNPKKIEEWEELVQSENYELYFWTIVITDEEKENINIEV